MAADTTYTRLYRETIPSVVSIYVTPERADGRASGGAGSGFVFDERGYVVTNAHVVRDAAEVDLRFGEGDWRTAAVEGTDVYTDLAVVLVDDLPPYAAPLALARDTPDPGEPVAAFGNPMGLDGTMTTGVVSGTGRSMPTGNGFSLPDTIQTDAAINPGNSGGPLVTPAGRVVGVNRATGGENIGFAVSPTILGRVVPALIEDGSYRHSYVRIRTLDVSPTVAEANGLDAPGGVLVIDVGSGSAGAALVESRGTRRVRGREIPVGGDVIVGIDGTEIGSHEELMRYLLMETRPGQVVEFDLRRDGRSVTERVELGERPDATPRRSPRRLSVEG